MATLDVTMAKQKSSEGRLSVLRCSLTGVVGLTVPFILCWLAAAAGLVGGSHMYVSLFTLAPVATASALTVGLCWSVVIGAFMGAVIALSYNAFGFLERR